MNKLLRSNILITTLAVLLMSFMPAHAQTQQFPYFPQTAENMITNGSLERANPANPNFPQDFSCGTYGANDAKCTIIRDGAVRKGVQVTATVFDESIDGDGKVIFKDVAVVPGVPYAFRQALHTIRLNQDSPVKVEWVVRYLRADGSLIKHDGFIPVAESPAGWNKLIMRFTPPSEAAWATAFCRLLSVGTIQSDEFLMVRDSFVKTPFVLTADDGYKEHESTVSGMLQQYDIYGTFFVFPNGLGDARRVSLLNLNGLTAAGHEIGHHSYDHAENIPLMDQQQQVLQIFTSKTIAGEQIGGSQYIRVYAYPNNQYIVNGIDADKWVRGAFQAARISDEGLNLRTQDHYRILSVVVDRVLHPDVIPYFKSQIDLACETGRAIVPLIHQVDGSGSRYSITRAELGEILKYAKQKIDAGQMESLTMSGLVSRMVDL